MDRHAKIKQKIDLNRAFTFAALTKIRFFT
jgi:hypothetical protein